jgi:hypothetical protein
MATNERATDAVDPALCCTSVVETPLSHAEATGLAHVLAALADPISSDHSLPSSQRTKSVHVTSRRLLGGASRPSPITRSCWPKPVSSWVRSEVAGCGGALSRPAWPMCTGHSAPNGTSGIVNSFRCDSDHRGVSQSRRSRAIGGCQSPGGRYCAPRRYRAGNNHQRGTCGVVEPPKACMLRLFKSDPGCPGGAHQSAELGVFGAGSSR